MGITPQEFGNFIVFAAPLLKDRGDELSWDQLIDCWSNRSQGTAVADDRLTSSQSRVAPQNLVEHLDIAAPFEDRDLIKEAWAEAEFPRPSLRKIQAGFANVVQDLSQTIIDGREDRV